MRIALPLLSKNFCYLRNMSNEQPPFWYLAPLMSPAIYTRTRKKCKKNRRRRRRHFWIIPFLSPFSFFFPLQLNWLHHISICTYVLVCMYVLIYANCIEHIQKPESFTKSTVKDKIAHFPYFQLIAGYSSSYTHSHTKAQKRGKWEYMEINGQHKKTGKKRKENGKMMEKFENELHCFCL